MLLAVAIALALTPAQVLILVLAMSSYLYVPSFKGPDKVSGGGHPDSNQASHVSSGYILGVMAKTSASDRVLVA